MKRFLALSVILLVTLVIAVSCTLEEQREITVFAGAASKPALEEAARAFEQETGIKVYFNFSGSGTVLSQMRLSKSGDLYIPGSPDYMVKAERDGVIDPETTKVVSYLIPAILVQKGNPKNIRGLSDLARPGLRVGIGNPEAVCVGLYTIEVLERNNLLSDVGKNIETYAESCEKAATLIALKSVDAVIGWSVFADWHPDTIDVVYLEPDQIPRLAYIPAAISTFTRDRKSAQKFLDFLGSSKGQEIFSRHGYTTTESEARKFAPDAVIGGEYQLPEAYKSLVK